MHIIAHRAHRVAASYRHAAASGAETACISGITALSFVPAIPADGYENRAAHCGFPFRGNAVPESSRGVAAVPLPESFV